MAGRRDVQRKAVVNNPLRVLKIVTGLDFSSNEARKDSECSSSRRNSAIRLQTLENGAMFVQFKSQQLQFASRLKHLLSISLQAVRQYSRKAFETH